MNIYKKLIETKRTTVRSRIRIQQHPMLEILEDRLAPAAFTVTTALDNGVNNAPTAGSIREAINKVNDGTFDGINFNIGAGAQKITVKNAALPKIIRKVTIDGTTGALKTQTIELFGGDPSLVGTGADGLSFAKTNAGNAADGSRVIGLTIDGFPGDGIRLDNVAHVNVGSTCARGAVIVYGNGMQGNDAGGGNGIHITGVNAKDDTVQVCIIGTDAGSKAGIGNNDSGILIDNAASDNTIGGLDDAEINLISGNKKSGVSIVDANINTIAGNFIGTKKDGTGALSNGRQGVFIGGDSKNNRIGVTVTTLGGVIVKPANVISGNSDGVVISGVAATTNKVMGNYIGTDKTGMTADPNTDTGVYLSNTTGNTIGGAQPGALNVISGNTSNGIAVDQNSHGNLIRYNNIGTGPDENDETVQLGNGYGVKYYDTSFGNTVKECIIDYNIKDGIVDLKKFNKEYDPNSIFDNGYGIDTGSLDGVPDVTSAVASGNTITITGTLTSSPLSSFVLEFFGNTVAERQGKQYLGNTTVATDANGFASYKVTYSVTPNTIFGNFITATSTGTADNGFTSEFSNDVLISISSGFNLIPGVNSSDAPGPALTLNQA